MNTPTSHRPSRSRSRRGAAMIEMVLVLPFFLVVISLIFYLGRGSVRVQHTQVVDRYEAWRAASGAPEPSANNLLNNTTLNQTFYNNKAVTMEIDEHNIRVNELDDLFKEKIEDDPKLTPEGANLAHEIYFRNAAWFFAHVKSVHDMSANLWNKLDGPMYHTHVRAGHEWSFATIWHKDAATESGWASTGGGGREETAIREAYFQMLEDVLLNLKPSVNDPTPNDTTPKPGLANRIRAMYVSAPGYVGPTVKY